MDFETINALICFLGEKVSDEKKKMIIKGFMVSEKIQKSIKDKLPLEYESKLLELQIELQFEALEINKQDPLETLKFGVMSAKKASELCLDECVADIYVAEYKAYNVDYREFVKEFMEVLDMVVEMASAEVE